jgi:hypothetical protein
VLSPVHAFVILAGSFKRLILFDRGAPLGNLTPRPTPAGLGEVGASAGVLRRGAPIAFVSASGRPTTERRQPGSPLNQQVRSGTHGAMTLSFDTSMGTPTSWLVPLADLTNPPISPG